MIQVTNLSKTFDDFTAVDNISFSIKKGEIFGLLGPNGAGKSTTLNMMSSILKSDSGSVIIDNVKLKDNPQKIKRLIGVVPQEISLYDEFSAYDNLLFWGKLYAIPIKELKQRINTILELIGLFDRKDDLVKTYSGGMKRRINIAAALLHHPKVLFLDEPTVGIDPQSRNRIFEIIEQLNNDGVTIIYTTHYMEEVERLCNRIAIIDSGRIIAQGTQSELQKLSNSKEKVCIDLKTVTPIAISELKSSLQLPIIQNDTTICIDCNANSQLASIISKVNDLGLEIENLELKKVNLESVFLNLTGKQLRD